jgi:hypothetical protein
LKSTPSAAGAGTATGVGSEGRASYVDVTANGAARAEVAAGEPVTFSAFVEVPRGVGTIVAAEWDFDGSGEYAV